MTSSDNEPQIPTALQFIKNRYEVSKELGRGGMGLVYLARDVELHNRPVVIKVLRDAYSGEWITKKFRQEIEALARIDHPGIVGIFDAGELPEGQLFVVMQYVDGRTLRTVMKQGPLSFERIGRIVDQIGRALGAAHEKGVLHCDLKPENIMLQNSESEEDTVKLIDFGIAKIRDSQVASGEPTRIAGTIDYMAPEQFQGAPVPATDVFALGVIAFEMITGVKPYPSKTVFQLLESFRLGILKDPSELRHDLPASASQVLMKAISIGPEQRYQKAREFSDELVKSLHSESEFQPTTVLPACQPEIFQSTRTMTRSIYWIVAILALSIAGFLAYSRYSAKAPLSLKYAIEFQDDSNKMRLVVSNSESGYLYLIGEDTRESDPHNVLFPLGGNSAHIDAMKDSFIPPQDWFRMELDAGPQTMWLIFARNAVPELESVKSFANPRDRGVITDPARSNELKSYLADPANSVKNKTAEGKSIILTSNDDKLVYKVVVDHP